VKGNISPRDWQDLSAFLDRQLNDRQHGRLEARLRADPALQSALDELRQMQALLRSQPKPLPRRNFTLTPAMAATYSGIVNPKRSSRNFHSAAIPALSLASALASILFLAVLVGDLLTRRTPLTAVQPMEVTRQELSLEAEMDSKALQTVEAQATAIPESTLGQMAAPKVMSYPAPTELATLLPESPPSAESEANLAQAVDTQSTTLRALPGEGGVFGMDRQATLGVELSLALLALSAGIGVFYLKWKAR